MEILIGYFIFIDNCIFVILRLMEVILCDFRRLVSRETVGKTTYRPLHPFKLLQNITTYSKIAF